MSSDFGRVLEEILFGCGFGRTFLELTATVSEVFRTGGDELKVSFRKFLKLAFSTAPSVEWGASDSGFGFGFTGGGVLVRCRARGSPSFGSGGNLKLRCGFGDRTGVGE